MKFCPECGQKLTTETSKFCNECGTALRPEGGRQTADRPTNAVADQGPRTTHLSQPNEMPDSWNWGAFLLPGVWMVAHRLKASMVAITCLGVPFLIALISLFVNLAQWKGDSSLDGGFFALEHATVSVLWVLGIYVIACLCSIRVARRSSAIAFQNSDGAIRAQFDSSQKNWAVGGIIFALVVISASAILGAIYQKAYTDVNTISPRQPTQTQGVQ